MFGCASYGESFLYSKKTSVVAAKNGGQVLLRTFGNPACAKPRDFRAMSGDLNLA
jgi:hypothetical protein